MLRTIVGFGQSPRLEHTADGVVWDGEELAGPRQENLLAGFSSFHQARPHAASENT